MISSTGCRPSTMFEHAFVGQLGAAIILLDRQLCQPANGVKRGDDVCVRLQPTRSACAPIRGAGSNKFLFEFIGLVVGREDFFFVFFQLRSDVPFGILECLFADKLGWNFVAMGMGDFQVVSENLVVADFQTGNPGFIAQMVCW